MCLWNAWVENGNRIKQLAKQLDKLIDVVKVVRDDEAGHRDVNHSFANILNDKIFIKKSAEDQKAAEISKIK